MLITCPECGRNVSDAAVVCIGCGHPIEKGTPAPAPAPAPVQGIRDFPAHAVSTTKLVVLSLVTFGLYEIYWFYRNWKLMRDRQGEAVSPFWRAVFSPLTAYSLFERIKGIEGPGREAGWGASGLAVAYLLTISAWRLPDPWWLVSLLSFVVLIPVQGTINEVAVERGLQVDRSFSGWNVMALVVGGVLLFGATAVTVQDAGLARLPVDGRELAVGGEVWGTAPQRLGRRSTERSSKP